MLNQNITTLLSALLGGMLTILGGFIANYYIQKSTKRAEKRKETREILENISQNLLAASEIYNHTNSFLRAGKVNEINIHENTTKLRGYQNKMIIQVHLYFPQLNEPYESLSTVIFRWIEYIRTNYQNIDIKIIDEIETELNTVTWDFLDKIANFLKKYGYNYM